jgi:hypothetical protein
MRSAGSVIASAARTESLFGKPPLWRETVAACSLTILTV